MQAQKNKGEAAMSKKSIAGKEIILLAILTAALFITAALSEKTTITGLAIEPINSIPEWSSTTKFQIEQDSFIILNLDEHFTDHDRDQLAYLASPPSSIQAEISGQQLKITPYPGFTGERTMPIFASDGKDTTRQEITIQVTAQMQEQKSQAAPAIQNTLKDQNGMHVGKKIKEDYTFDTIIDSIERTAHELIITFHHNANDELPVWIEGRPIHKLSKETALPGETITLTIPLIKGVIPKFKLHIGTTSDIFEFGKTIPRVQITDHKLNLGEYSVYDREDDYVDVEITKGESRAVLNAVDAEEITARIGQISELKTEVIAIDPVPMGGATITLKKTGKVSLIKTCENFNTQTFTCQGKWAATSIPFIEIGNTIVFTVTHFSAYAGGAATQLIIWDDSDLSTQFTGAPMSFYANFTNTTGPANNTNGSCRIRFNTTGSWSAYQNMTFNATGTDIYNHTSTFTTQGTPYKYEINCTGTGENIAATDNFYVYQLSPNQGLFACISRTGIKCLPGETKVLGLSAPTNAHAELASQNNYNTSICCQDLSGRNTILTTGTTFLNLSNTTNAHAALPNTTIPYNYSANITGSTENITCTYTQSSGQCTYPQGCLATISNDTNAHVSGCTNNPYNLTICCGFPQAPLNSTINATKSVSPSPATIGSTVTYTILLQNLGPGTAHNITVNESYPNRTTYLSATPAPSTGNNTWTIASLAAGTSTTIKITLRIQSTVANNAFLNNTANITWQNDTGGNLSTTANAGVRAVLPAPSSGGGWAATEGARQYYQRTAETITEQTAACYEQWHCTDWSECINLQKTRTCTDKNACGTEYSKPAETTTCTIEQPAMPAEEKTEEYMAPIKQMPASSPEKPEIKKSKPAMILPFITYGLLMLLAAVLLIYLIKEHLAGKKTHPAWQYLLYALLTLTGVSIIAEILITEQVPYISFFMLLAIILVFTLDIILRNIPKKQALPKEKTAITQTKSLQEDQLEEISRKLKELKI